MHDIKELDGFFLHRMFSWGSHRVSSEKDHINKINVFPVADGDTGTNLSNTMRSMILNSKAEDSVENTMTSIAGAVIRGARGNSGLILSEFFSGFALAVNGIGTLGTHDFASAVKSAAGVVPLALENPKSGTILTVIENWAESLVHSKKYENFKMLLSESLLSAEKALERTMHQNSVLKDAGVVDAGGYGFVAFIKGCLSFFDDVKKGYPENIASHTALEMEEEIQEQSAHKYSSVPPEYRYCCETLLSGKNIKREMIKQSVAGTGNCLVIAGAGNLSRVHLHTDDPQVFVEKLSRLGTVAEQKVDDMLSEYHDVFSRKHNTAIVTDSSCDMPQELLDKYNIHVVPINIVSGDNSYLDRLTISRESVFKMMESKKNYPKTAQPTSAVFSNLYSFLLTYYDSIISIHISGHLSGTVQSARKAANLFSDKKIDVIDSLTLSGSLGLMVCKAGKLLDEGKNHDEVVSEMMKYRPLSRNYVSVKNLKYMVRGGRVSPLKGLAASLLNLKPIISIDREGKSELWGKAFSRKTNDKKIIKYVKKTAASGELEEYAVVHSGMEKEAEKIASVIESHAGKPPLYISAISPVISLNAGPEALSVVLLRKPV
ncbi:MAG: DegV family protein [Spirochaetia bacterium]|jgi:DegV family protein with EDD domain|nr:DegV family protein [Spirochaetia bacterium]